MIAGDSIRLGDRDRLSRRGGNAVGGEHLGRAESPRAVDKRADARANVVDVGRVDDLLLACEHDAAPVPADSDVGVGGARGLCGVDRGHHEAANDVILRKLDFRGVEKSAE